jgi:uncharacterized protein involved in outer membrane biogenesis
MSKPKKTILAIVCIIVAFVIAAVFIGPGLFQVDRYRLDVIAFLDQQTGRRMEMARLAVSVLPTIAIRVDHFAIRNPSGFPAGDWLSIQRIDASLDFRALLRRETVIRSLKLREPVLDLIEGPHGAWNFQIARTRPPIAPSPGDPPLFSMLEIMQLHVSDGIVRARGMNAEGRAGPVVLEADGVSGDIGHFDVTALEAPSATSGKSLVWTTSPNSPSSASVTSATGKLGARSLHFGNLQATHIETTVRALPGDVHLDDLRLDLYGGKILGNLMLQLAQSQARYQAAARFSGISVGQLLANFRAARGKMTGTVGGQATFSGVQAGASDELAGAQGEGTLTIQKGSWPELRLNQNLLDLARLAKLGLASGDPSKFSSISADWSLAGGVLTASHIRVVGNGITVEGSGTVDLAGSQDLHFQGMAEIKARQNPLSGILAQLSGGTFQGGIMRLPFIVTGTLQKPVFQLKQAAGTPSRSQKPNIIRRLRHPR